MSSFVKRKTLTHCLDCPVGELIFFFKKTARCIVIFFKKADKYNSKAGEVDDCRRGNGSVKSEVDGLHKLYILFTGSSVNLFL